MQNKQEESLQGIQELAHKGASTCTTKHILMQTKQEENLQENRQGSAPLVRANFQDFFRYFPVCGAFIRFWYMETGVTVTPS